MREYFYLLTDVSFYFSAVTCKRTVYFSTIMACSLASSILAYSQIETFISTYFYDILYDIYIVTVGKGSLVRFDRVINVGGIRYRKCF